jgi:hypothetical protein
LNTIATDSLPRCPSVPSRPTPTIPTTSHPITVIAW